MKYSGCMKIMYYKGAKMYFFKFQNLPFSSSFFTKFFPLKSLCLFRLWGHSFNTYVEFSEKKNIYLLLNSSYGYILMFI